MSNNLRILHLEDEQSDALLVSYALKQGGLEFDYMVVDTKERFLEALNNFDPGIILADHSLPSFNSYEALELLEIRGNKIPVILVTAAMSDEFAVNALKKGAKDYILKDRLKRLPSAIRNVLKAQSLEKERDGFLIQLQRNERKFRSLIENGADAVVILTPDGTPSYVTPSFMKVMGYSEMEALKLNIYEIIHENDQECVREKLKECLASPQVPFKGYIVRARHQDGSWRWLEVTLANYMEDLAIEGIVADFRDVSESKRAEKELKRSKELAENLNVQKDHFIANMSHELRTPIHAILGFTELLLEEETNLTKKLYIESVKTAGDNLLYIINDILDLSKIGAGIIQLEKHPFNLLFIIKNVFAILHLKAHQKQLLFKFHVDPEVKLHLVGDKNRLTQILINLLGNALKFTSTGSVKLYVDHLKSEKGTTTLQFRVEDTGIGIPEAKRGAIFDRFSQAEENTSRTFGGTGLGLNISQQLINRQGGNITVESEAGKGSVFSFYLSFGIGKVAPIKKEAQPEVIHGKKREANVLLCEDNELNQRLIMAILTEKGYSIDLAENGKIGVELLENKNYDLVLMDIQMPVMDGYETTQKIRQEIKSTVPVVALTANFLLAERAKCLQLGMNDYLSKPFTKVALLNMVDHWLSEKIEEKQENIPIEESKGQKEFTLRIMEELSGGSKYFIKEPFNLLSVINNVFSIFELKAQQKNLFFQFHIDPEVNLQLVGDKNRLTQILINLLGNALKFTTSGGVNLYVDHLNFEKSSTTLQFKVVDTGIGILKEKIDSIFGGIIEDEEDTSGTFGCTGLGLNISQQLIQRQGGSIRVESEVDKGSIFIFYLPFGIEEVISFRQKVEMEILSEKKGTASILVCEENELTIRLIRSILTEKGYTIDLAENGVKGLKLLENKSYDLILMDIHMPLIDGYEATKKIRQGHSFTVPIVALTPNFLPAEKAKCLELGMNDYLVKPFKKADLLNIVDLWLKVEKEEEQELILVEEPQEQKIVSLSTLEELSGGNKEFQNEMMGLFMLQSRKMFEEIKVFSEAKNIEGIKSTAHKMKTSFGIIGADSKFLGDLGNNIEANLETREFLNTLNSLESQLNDICDILKEIIITPSN